VNPDNPVNISTKRTAVNTAVVGYVLYLISFITGREFTIDADDPINLIAPAAVGVLIGIGYRLSRWATAKWPSLGWVLFGSGKEPTAVKPITKEG
jgi:uncharacterized membrane protein